VDGGGVCLDAAPQLSGAGQFGWYFKFFIHADLDMSFLCDNAYNLQLVADVRTITFQCLEIDTLKSLLPNFFALLSCQEEIVSFTKLLTLSY
jgi:hypothetical protein